MRRLVYLLTAAALLLATGSAVLAQSLDESAAEIGHMTEDVAKARGAVPAEARALTREIAGHAEEARYRPATRS